MNAELLRQPKKPPRSDENTIGMRKFKYYLSDRTTILDDSDGRKVGNCKEGYHEAVLTGS